MMFLHGFSGHPDVWQPVLARLPSPRQCLVPSLAGHQGGSPAGRGAEAFRDEVDRLAELIVGAGGEPKHVVGYSLGGRLALGLAVHHPALVRRLTLIGAHPGLQTMDERDQRAATDETWAQQLERDGLRAFVTAWEQQPLFAHEARLPLETRQRQTTIRLRHDPRGLASALRAFSLARMPDYWSRLPGMAASCAFIAGELDRKFVGIGKRVCSLISAAFIEVSGSGHNVVMENPESIVREIKNDKEFSQ
jgi:2-succinyl-6-hydroxy-2,4-cyclohexadiene-1-carboxylate synthase